MEKMWRQLAIELHDRCRDAQSTHRRLRLSLLEIIPPKKTTVSRLTEVVSGLPEVPRSGRLECEYLTDELVACFYGPVSAYNKFQEIGRDIYDWLRATDLSLPAKDSYGGWLKMLYAMTLRCPATGFEHTLEPTVLHLEKIPDEFVPYYRVFRYRHSPFAISSAALRMFIEPYETRFLRPFSSHTYLVPWQLACIFANPRLARLGPTEIQVSGLKSEIQVIGCRTPTRRPQFLPGDNFTGSLRFCGQTLIDLKAGSKWLCSILARFQERNWPDEMDTPTNLGDDFKHAARVTVKRLNERIVGSPKIVFKDMNSGARIRWWVAAGNDSIQK